MAIAIAIGWYVDRRQLLGRIQRQNTSIANYWEKHSVWSPSGYLRVDIPDLEARLTDCVDRFEGKFVTSSQGMSIDQLRQPTLETLDAVVALLDNPDESTRIVAAQLIALYLQGVSGSKDIDTNSLVTRAHFQIYGMSQARVLLGDPNVEVRRAAALILGNTISNRRTVRAMTDAFNKETDQTAKIYLAWAYWKLANNYDKLDFIQSAAQ